MTFHRLCQKHAAVVNVHHFLQELRLLWSQMDLPAKLEDKYRNNINVHLNHYHTTIVHLRTSQNRRNNVQYQVTCQHSAWSTWTNILSFSCACCDFSEVIEVLYVHTILCWFMAGQCDDTIDHIDVILSQASWSLCPQHGIRSNVTISLGRPQVASLSDWYCN